jgi:alpha-methylacyl-CoA racemase
VKLREQTEGGGPLSGVRVVELAGIGPSEHGVMLLADLGAEVVRIDRVSDVPANICEELEAPRRHFISRGRRSVGVDLKSPSGLDAALHLIDRADVLVDPYRPGVAERLGLGPEVCRDRNAGLVYARMTGWGQEGPLASSAGHDINFIASVGALEAIGSPAEVPPPPLNLVGDFGGGGMLLAFGVVSALFARQQSGTGTGDVIDVAMVDGVASLMSGVLSLAAIGEWDGSRGSHWLQGAAPWYRAYRTADSRFVTVGAFEDKFYRELLERLDLDPERWPQWEEELWPRLHVVLEEIFAGETLETWRARLEGTDSCFAPALPFREAAAHPQVAARETYVHDEGVLQPAPVPRFAERPGGIKRPAPVRGEHTVEVFSELGLDEDEIERMQKSGALAGPVLPRVAE